MSWQTGMTYADTHLSQNVPARLSVYVTRFAILLIPPEIQQRKYYRAKRGKA